MIQTNIADFKSHLSEYLQKVQAGESLEICKRNIPLAKVLPFPAEEANGTVLGCGRKTLQVKTDLTEPVLQASDWDMLGEKA
jgi:prevent-host-death family protein